MSTAPLTTAPEATSHQQDVLNDLVDLGHELARLVVEQAKTRILAADKASTAFDRVTRCIRRCIWLERYLARPLKAVDRTAARKQIIRKVEDAIQREADDPEQAETLHEELRERLDSPDLEDEIHGRAVDEIITDILRDLGLAAPPGTHPWKRRTPADLTELDARARNAANGGAATTIRPRDPRAEWPSASNPERHPFATRPEPAHHRR